MGIETKVLRKLWANSGGFCANPDCHADLFPFYENKEITNIEELAHIIGQKLNGPRGNATISLNQRDTFDNIIILCPSCHTKIDKNPSLYPEEKIIKWKKNHENNIRDLYIYKKFDTRESIRNYIFPLLIENKTIFNKYGPLSANAKKDKLATEMIWERLSIEKLLPNNRTIEQIINVNYELMNEIEKQIYADFKLHREGFEFNKLSGDVNALVPQFPQKFETIFI